MRGTTNVTKLIVVASAVALLVTGAVLGGCRGDSPSSGGKRRVTGPAVEVAGEVISVEIAATQERRNRGYMQRTSIPDGKGLLFVFPESQRRVQRFWMKNCLIPIDIAYIADDGRITALHTMAVEPEGQSEAEYTRYSSEEPVIYALEVRGGWFAEHGVKVGGTIDIARATAGVKPR